MAPTNSPYRGVFIDVVVKKTQGKSTLQVSVPAKIVGKAVERNKIKRWCREVWRKTTLAKEKNKRTEVRLKKPNNSNFEGISKDFIQYIERET